MPGAIHNYWLGIMALAFVLAVSTWIGLVFWASRHPAGKLQDSWPHRDVMGGAFSAREGGRQVAPDPRLPPESETQVEAEHAVAAGPPAPRESPETGVGAVRETTGRETTGQETTGQETEVKTGRT